MAEPLALHSLILPSPMPISHMRLSFSARIALAKTASLALPLLTMRMDAEWTPGSTRDGAEINAENDAEIDTAIDAEMYNAR